MPTYRNHKTSKYTNYFKYGVPILDTKEDFFKLNEILKKEQTLLIIKLHPAENIEPIKVMNLSNIKFLDSNVLYENDVTIYHCLKGIDALITDYSSIFYDFLLLNRPIGLAIPDLEEYKKNNKLFIKKFDDLGSDCLYNFIDIKNFILNLSKGIDSNYSKRLYAIKKFHKYTDNNSSSRFVDFFEKVFNKKV